LFDYKTVEEKAAEWGVTPRNIQHLCRNGGIEGAVKRGGVWFIPDEAPNPMKNTKTDAKPFMFVGTKKKIFDTAIQLFHQQGYENVSISDIAKSVGIRQSAVYNHFKSKQEILDTIYAYFSHHFLLNRPTLDEFESWIQTDDLFDVFMKSFVYQFEKDSLDQMQGIVRIVLQRSAVDRQAADLFYEYALKEGIDFAEECLNKAVKIGRIAQVDSHLISVLLNSIRIYTLVWWVIKPPEDAFKRILEDEMAFYRHIVRSMTDTLPPNK